MDYTKEIYNLRSHEDTAQMFRYLRDLRSYHLMEVQRAATKKEADLVQSNLDSVNGACEYLEYKHLTHLEL